MGRKEGLKRFVSVIMICIMLGSMLTGIPIQAEIAEDEQNENEIIVHYYNYKKWEQPYIYYYYNDKKGTPWPGEAMQEEEDGWYCYTIKNYRQAKVLFNNGKKEQVPEKNQEGFLVSGEMWYKNGDWFEEQPEDCVVHFYKPVDWQSANIYYYRTENDTGTAWTGEPMKKEEDGWYSYTIKKYAKAKVLFNDGKGTQIPERNEEGFSVSGEMWYKDGKWFDEEPENIVIHFYKPDDWGKPRLYYYKTPSETGVPWPGELMKDEQDGWYQYEVKPYVDVRVLFNDGKNQIPGKMIEGFSVSKEVWYKDGQWYDKNPDYSEDADTDGDGLTDVLEVAMGTNRLLSDTDKDGLPDGFEVMSSQTDALLADTDGNGISDGDEDFDGDKLSNKEEYNYGTDPYLKDTDDDGFTDFEEVTIYHTDALSEDTDGDGILDGDELSLGFQPLLYDTDGNGISDGDEKVLQVLEQEIEEDEKTEVTKVAVEFEENGNINKTTTIENMYGVDMLSSEVVGLVGVPVEIETEDAFEKAKITFTYDANKLGKIKEEELSILWYNEKENRYELMDSQVDKNQHTVSCETTHFSTYMLVDKQQWYGIWRNNINYRSTTSGAIQSYDIAYVIDKSGSMEGEAITETKKVVHSFLDAMESNDKGCVVAFDYSAYLLAEMGSDKDKIKESLNHLSANGGTNTDEGLKLALNQLKQEKESDAKAAIMICDGDVNYIQTTIDDAKKHNIKVYTVLIGTDLSGEADLVKISSETGGEYYHAKTANELGDIFRNLRKQTIEEIDTTDTDGDGLYDVYETKGMLAPNGQVITTDPNKADTDGDGLTDYEECGEIKEVALKIGNEMKTVHMLSFGTHPWMKDTDGDGIYDPYDKNKKKDKFPSYFVDFINLEIAKYNDVVQTKDGFSMCKQPMSVILSKYKVKKIKDGKSWLPVKDYYDDWYLYCVKDGKKYVYSLLKMREKEHDEKDGDDPGTSVSFMEFDVRSLVGVSLQKSGLEKLSQGISRTIHPYFYSKSAIIQTPDKLYSASLQKYFAKTKSTGSYLIANQYIKKVIKEERNGNELPVYLDKMTKQQTAYLQGLKGIYDQKKNVIKLKDINALTKREKQAVLVSRTGNISQNSFAGENQFHAVWLKRIAELLKSYKPVTGKLIGAYRSALVSDTGIDEEEQSGVTDWSYLEYEGTYVAKQRKAHGDK